MAKLEDLVTPSEILDVMKDGAVKADLIKRFKTSDAELAKMLLPLYRSGQLTKEEFNSFFQGLPIVQQELPREISDTIPDMTLEEPTPEEPEPLPPQVAEAPKLTPPVAEALKVAPIVAEPPEPAPFPPPEELVAEVEEVPEAVSEVVAEELSFVENQVEVVAEELVAPDEVQDEVRLPSGILELILARLSSIDKRLSGIEKKLGLA
jgi:hypothetical protein